MYFQRWSSTLIQRCFNFYFSAGKLLKFIREVHVKASEVSFKTTRAQGISTVAIFLSNDHSLYAPIYLRWMSCLISFEWYQSTCQERVKSDKMQNEKLVRTVRFKPKSLRSKVWCSTNWANRAKMKAVLLRPILFSELVVILKMVYSS